MKMRKLFNANFLFYSIFVFFVMGLLGIILQKILHEAVENAVMKNSVSAEIGFITSMIWILVGLACILLLILLIIISYNTFEKYIKPIRNVSQVAEKLANGNYNARTYETYFGDGEKLASSINLLARNLQEVTIQQEIQTSRLLAVIENMNSGLLLINEKGYIQLVNRAFLEEVCGDSTQYIGYLYYEAIRNEEIQNVIRDIFMLEEAVQRTIIVPNEMERKFLSISGAPIFDNTKKYKGIILVFHNITETKKLEEMRKDFVANVSHELKTPITSIKGFSETLLEGAKDDPEALNQFLQIIYKESDRMEVLIHDLLELSKLEKADFQLALEKVSLKKLVEDVLSYVEYTAIDKEITLKSNITAPFYIYAEPNRITQLLLNLIVNGILYTKPGGIVEINAEEENYYVILSVSDTGIGIPQEELPRIFERFYRVDKARSRQSGGTGLGLAIVKHIVEAHHGKMEVESKMNKGTTFRIYLKKLK